MQSFQDLRCHLHPRSRSTPQILRQRSPFETSLLAFEQLVELLCQSQELGVVSFGLDLSAQLVETISFLRRHVQ
jgi:hypothetical protein